MDPTVNLWSGGARTEQPSHEHVGVLSAAAGEQVIAEALARRPRERVRCKEVLPDLRCQGWSSYVASLIQSAAVSRQIICCMHPQHACRTMTVDVGVVHRAIAGQVAKAQRP